MTKFYLREESPTQSFALGSIYVTRGVEERIPRADLLAAFARHSHGDWGEVDDDDWDENELSLKHGYRLLSAYRAKDGTKFWIITEADRSSSTALLPEEY